MVTTWIVENILWVGIGFAAILVGIKVAAFRLLARMTRSQDGGANS